MAINADYFDDNALQAARGVSSSDAGAYETNGGIVNPHRVHLPTGQYDYRFASSDRSLERRRRGCWWIEYEVMTKIARFAREQDSTPPDAARYFLALPWSWTKVDRLLRGRLVARVDAYRGEGKPAAGTDLRDAGTRFIPPQHIRELHQLYIPGLQHAEIADRAFDDVSDEEIRNAPIFA